MPLHFKHTDAEGLRDIMTNENKNLDLREDMLEGRNPVFEALKAGRQIDKILIAKGGNKGSITRILAIAKERKILVSEVERAKLDTISQTHAHQGIIAYTAAAEYVSVKDILNVAKSKNEPPFIIICDSLNDAHNLGSIIRSAECCGAHGVIIPKHRSVGLSAACAKAAAGATEYMGVCKVTNLARTIDELKKEGLWVCGTDAEGEQLIYDADLKGPLAIVIGSEGEGMSRLVKESCDFLVRIPMSGHVNSLNASAAAAVLMYEAVRQRNI